MQTKFLHIYKQDKICPIGHWDGEIGLMVCDPCDPRDPSIKKSSY